MPLTHAEIEREIRTNPKRPLKLTDSGHLFLLVSKVGTARWYFRTREFGDFGVTENGKPRTERERVESLNAAFPGVSLKAARDLADAKRLAIAANPPAPTPAAPAAEPAGITFGDLFDQFLARAYEGKAARTLSKFTALKPHFKSIWRKSAASITPPQLLAVLLEIERGKGGSERRHTARRACAYVRRMYAHAIARELVTSNPAGSLLGELKPDAGGHRLAVTDQREFGQLLREVYAYKGTPALQIGRVLQLLAHFACRPGELLGARWDEFQLDGAAPRWTIPAERTKMRKEHLIPLSRQAVEILREVHDFDFPANDPEDLVFPGRSGDRVIPTDTLARALELMGYKGRHQAHGFRVSFSTILHELGHSSDLIELACGREIPGVRAIYNRSERLKERGELFQKWSDHIDALRAGK